MRILITRPQESAAILASQLTHLGHEVTVDSLIHLTPIDPGTLDLTSLATHETIIATSQQAIRCLANLTSKRTYILWCVGEESAKVAKNLGFQHVHQGGGSAELLLAEFLKAQPSLCKPILHISGDIIRTDIVHELIKMGIEATRMVVYTTHEANTFLPQTLHTLQTNALDAILFYSPRTAKIFKKLCRDTNLDVECACVNAICLSDAIKTEIEDLPWKSMRIAKKSTTDDLLLALMMAD
ncbi:MAG: uroporphyrinogen-III synthase [Alphaproteobacteria bacterium]|jgi:uroporphyrinogen-III synthase|nr:uroporphyrinogen-III synthase [Alphaproteobacteria bacterium]